MATAKTIVREELDKKNDHVYFETKGMAAGFDNPAVLEAELTPGEGIAREFNVNTRIKNKRTTLQLFCMSIVTFGLYFLWIKCCSCCRSKTMGNERRKVVVTTNGRVLMWRHDSAGRRSANLCCCFKASEKVSAYTQFRSFHLHDINTVQTLYFSNRPFPCCCTRMCGSDYGTFLRIAVGDKYPNMSALASPSNFAMPTLETEYDVNWGPAAEFSNGSGKRGFNQTTHGSGAGELIMEVYSGSQAQNSFDLFAMCCKVISCGLCQGLGAKWEDSVHGQDDAAFSDAGAFQRFLVDNRVGYAWCGEEVQPATDSFVMHDEADGRRHMQLIKGGKVHVYPHLVGLMPGERVINAIPVYKKLKLGRCLTACCDRQWKADNVVILTNKRLMRVTRLNMPSMGEVGWEVTAHFLGVVGAGYTTSGARVKGKGNVFLGSVRTQYGGLTINTHVVGSKSCLPLHDAKIRKQADAMWTALANGSINTVMPAAIQAVTRDMPNAAALSKQWEQLPLQQGEPVLSGIRSKNQYALGGWWWLSPCACFHYMCLKNCVTCCSCGCRPFKTDQYIFITDRRVLAVTKATNPGFLCCLCKKRPQVLSWQPLDDVQMGTVDAEFVMPSSVGMCTRMLSPAFPCLIKAFASVQVTVGASWRQEHHPFIVKQYQPMADGGLAESPAILHFRKTLGAVVAARTAAAAYEVAAYDPTATGGAGAGSAKNV